MDASAGGLAAMADARGPEAFLERERRLADAARLVYSLPDADDAPGIADVWRGDDLLDRRLAAFRFGGPKTSPGGASPDAFCAGVLGAERLRDLAPAVVVALFETHLVLEPGDAGPLAYAAPAAQALVRALNARTLAGPALDALRRAGGALVDGCAVVGVVDYRRWAFAGGAGAERPHEMHKVLLRVPAFEISADIHSCSLGSKRIAAMDDDARLLLEGRVLAALSPRLCLSPEPGVFAHLCKVSYDIHKAAAHLRPAATCGGAPAVSDAAQTHAATTGLVSADAVLRGLHADGAPVSGHAERFVRRALRPLAAGAASVPAARLRILAAAEDSARARRRADAEAVYGLDARKDPGRLGLAGPPAFAWVPPGAAVWRSLRFEPRPGTPGPVVSVHVTATGAAAAAPGGAPRLFEAVVRIGSSPCANDQSSCLPVYGARHQAHSRRAAHLPSAVPRGRLSFSTASRAAMEAYVDGLRAALAAEGRVCVADVSNPAIFGAGQPLAVAAAAAGHRAAAAARAFAPSRQR